MKLPEEERLRRAKTRAKNAREKLDVASRLEEATTDIVKRMAANPAFIRFVPEAAVGTGAALVFNTPRKFAAFVSLPFAPLGAFGVQFPGGHVGFNLQGFEKGIAETVQRMYGLDSVDSTFRWGADLLHAGLIIVLLELAHEFVRALGTAARENIADGLEAAVGALP